jgi:hypothetical protein
MDDIERYPSQSFKIRIVQETEVEIFYHNGILSDDVEAIDDMVMEDAFSIKDFEGITGKSSSSSNNGNGYIAIVTPFEATVRIVYNIPDATTKIKKILGEEGFHDG